MERELTDKTICPLACLDRTVLQQKVGDDEIDLRELCLFLWKKKIVISLITAVVALGAVAYAFITPAVYKVSAQIRVVPERFDDGRVDIEAGREIKYLLDNAEIKNVLKRISNKEIYGLSFTSDKKDLWLYTIIKQGTNSTSLYEDVSTYVNHINSVYKEILLKEYQLEIDTLRQLLLSLAEKGKTRELLEEKLAIKLYAFAQLKRPEQEKIIIIQEPQLPTSPIKPKKTLVIILGILLGAFCGMAVVLVRFAFRKEE